MPVSRRVHVIEEPRQIRALASPARQEIVDALAAAGPCSVAELAEHVGRPADALYFHLKKLIEVGLVQEREAKRNGRHVASVFDVPGMPRMRYKAGGASGVERVVGAAVRLGGRDFVRALRAGATTEGAKRDLWGGRVKGWLTAAELKQANRLVDRLSRLLLGGRPGRGRKPQTFTWVLAPAKVGRDAKQRSAAGPRGSTS